MERNLLEVNRLHLKNIIKDMGDEKLLKEQHSFKVLYTYDAVGLEGTNKIPFEDVARLIKVGKINHYSEREQKEVLNHVACFKEIKKWVKDDVVLTEELLKDLHELLVKDIFQGGIYRNVNIQITDAIHQPPNHIKVYDRMKKIFNDETLMNLSNYEKAILIPARIAKVHPFLDGNGRLVRLIMNFYLMKADYLPISVSLDLRDKYFRTIECYKVERDIKPLEKFIEDSLILRYDKLIRSLEK